MYSISTIKSLNSPNYTSNVELIPYKICKIYIYNVNKFGFYTSFLTLNLDKKWGFESLF